MAISAATVADSISKMVFSSGVNITVKDLDQMQDEIFGRDCTVVMPAPNWLTVSEVERDNLGSGTAAQWTLTYVLSYRLFYKEVGQERNIGSVMAGLVEDTMAFIDEVFENDSITGALDMVLSGTPTFGVVEDPTGKMFWGADIELEVTEFIN